MNTPSLPPKTEYSALLENMALLSNGWTSSVNSDIEANLDIPIPPVENRRRIMGSKADADPDGSKFIKIGRNALNIYKNIYEVFSGKCFEKATFLDWGCGCGRALRHLPKEMCAQAHGADVDTVNLDWCKKNIPFGAYTQLYPSTPFPYKDDSFDLIYGTSVFTHLSEEEQFFWLKELNRVSRGYVLLSVHGLKSCAKAPWATDFQGLKRWLQKGYIDAPDALPDIADVVGPDYYRSTAHTWQYIHQNWNQHIHVVEMCGGGMGDHDIVVCRKMTATT